MSKVKEIVESIYSKPRKYKRNRLHDIIKQYNDNPKNNFTPTEKFINFIQAETYKKACWKRADHFRRKEEYKKYHATQYKKVKQELYEGVYSTLEKTCNRCKQTKHLFNFLKKKSAYAKPSRNAKGRYSLCKECRYETIKKYHKNNKEKYLSWRRKIENKLHNKLAHRCRQRLRTVVKYYKIEKQERTFDYLGCDIKTLISYIESKFTEGMTWEKYLAGDIEIDHIIPFCSVDLTKNENIHKICHYTNLQPLWWKDNNDKLHDNDIKLSIHRKNLDASS